MPLIGAFVLFSIFALNVFLGSFSRAPFLSDVGEMLMLSATAVLFVVGILKREAAAKKRAAQDHQ